MISEIAGIFRDKRTQSILVETNGISYEVWIPGAIMHVLERTARLGEPIKLVTYHYHQIEPSRSVPMLVGFLNAIEREFFERFITVSGVGPRAAVKALTLPFSTIAQAIDTGNRELLESLPGIGAQRAREIIAKLQGKVGKYGLIQDDHEAPMRPAQPSVQDEALAVLLQLQYRRPEARQMIQHALARAPQVDTVEALLNELYRQRSEVAHGERVG